jgi:hypothetical protein
MTSRIIAASLIAMLGAGAVSAQAVDRDVRCLIASNVFAQSEKDAQKRQVALASSFFFMGRLDGRVAPAQLKAQVLAQSKTLNKDNIGQTMDACAKAVQAKQQSIAAIGQQLQQQKPN